MSNSSNPKPKPNPAKDKATIAANRAKLKSLKVFWLAAGGVALVGVLGGVAAYWWLQRSQSARGLMGLASAIPQEAQVVMAFNTTSEPWQKLGQFGTPSSQKLLGESLDKSPFNAILKQSKMEFTKDVQPWLDGMVVSALVSDPLQPANVPATMVIAATKDRGKSETFLNQYRGALTQQGAKFTPQQYKDVTYYESPTRDPNSKVITADLGGRFVVIATTPAVMQRTIDTYRGEAPSLAKKPAFASVFTNPAPSQIAEPLMQVYLDGEVALAFLGAQAQINLGEPMITQSRQVLDAITVTAGTQKEGLRFEVTTYLKANATANPSTNTEAKIISKLPQETFLLISGNNLNQSWQSLNGQAKGNASSGTVLEQLRQNVKSVTKLDLESEVLSWMTGEFAIAAIPNNQGVLANSGFGLVAILQAKDTNAAESAFKKIDTAAQSASSGLLPKGVEVKTKTVGNKTLTTWQVGNTIVATRGAMDDGYVFWAMGDLSGSFVPKPTRTLPESNGFKILTSGLPKANGGYFYLNMTTALTLADRLLPAEVKTSANFTQIRAVLDAINGVAVTSSVIDNRTTRLDLLFTLKPTPGN
ncbi:MAG: DUF3352 domain-containing protein [Pseudanabaenaceae cyanobacterium]|jgi:hypothetical protein